jgi:hypothetical protein
MKKIITVRIDEGDITDIKEIMKVTKASQSKVLRVLLKYAIDITISRLENDKELQQG